MELDDWLRAIGLVLILEGLMPLLAPARWREVFLQVAIYCGVPAAIDSFRVASEVFKEMDL